MIPAVEYPSGWYDPPESPEIKHCDCEPCILTGCDRKNKSMDCDHGWADLICAHKFCVIDSCRILLQGEEEDFCEQHQLIHEMIHAERRR